MGSGVEVQLVVMLGGAEHIARFALDYLGSSLGNTMVTLATLAGGGQSSVCEQRRRPGCAGWGGLELGQRCGS